MVTYVCVAGVLLQNVPATWTARAALFIPLIIFPMWLKWWLNRQMEEYDQAVGVLIEEEQPARLLPYFMRQRWLTWWAPPYLRLERLGDIFVSCEDPASASICYRHALNEAPLEAKSVLRHKLQKASGQAS